LKCVEEIVVTFRVRPTVVEVSTRMIVPGESVDLVVAQAGPLRSKSWRVALIGQEHTIEVGTAPDPYNGQGEIVQPFLKSRPLCVVEIARGRDLTIPAGEMRREHYTFPMPADAVPQSWSRERSVTWGVMIEGDVNGWPKFTRVFPIAVVAATETVVAGPGVER
jgi:hypothetical protein